MIQKWYLIFKTSIYLTEIHKEFLETFDSEEHFSQWYARNFPHRVYGNKIVHFIDGANESCKLYGTLRLSIFSYISETEELNLWQEIKEAFPFWFVKRICGVIHYPWMMGKRELHIRVTLPGSIRSVPIEINFDNTDHDMSTGDKIIYGIAILVIMASCAAIMFMAAAWTAV